MTPDLWVLLLALILMLAYGLSQAYTHRQRIAGIVGGLLDAVSPVAPAPPPPARKRPRLPRRTPQDRQRELEWIELGLKGGLPLSFMARALRGSPAYNQRRVRKVRARMEQQAVTA